MPKAVIVGVEDSGGGETPLHQIALWVENGTETAPPRPNFRIGMERSIKKNQKMIQAQLGNIFRAGMRPGAQAQQLVDRRLTVMLQSIGKVAAAETKAMIKAGEGIPNAPATVAKKGFDHPWWVNGEVMRNVKYIVV
jgi:hypothetical protein